ncbi:MAG: glycosyltransferase family 4 protein, partial [Verrucomicrobiota bacterium]
LGKIRPDFIISHMTQPVFPLFAFCRQHGKKLLCIEHHSNALKSKKDWLLTWANHVLSDRSIYLTDSYVQDVSSRLGHAFRLSKTRVIPNALHVNQFTPSLRPSSRPRIIGMPARMVQGKDFQTLIRAFALLNPDRRDDLKLELVGDGPERSTHERLVESLHLKQHVKFLGALPQPTLITQMKTWSVFVLSTLGETMSRSITEAQALALPVLSTNVHGVVDSVVNGETGLLVPPQDHHAMAEGLERLLTEERTRGKLAEQGHRHTVHLHDADRVWERYRAEAVSILNH